MGLETGTYVNDLNTANPTSTDPKSQGDDHLRLIKSVLKNTFVGFTGLIVGTGVEAQGATVNDFTVTVVPAPAAYTANFFIGFKATHANTGATTIQVNALGTKSLTAIDGQALVTGDITANEYVVAWYNGTQFYLVSGNDRSHRGGDTYAGTHDFSAVTDIRVPTKAQGDNSTRAASTAYVDTSTAAEAAIRTTNDNTLQGNINTEAAARIAGDNALAANFALYALLNSPAFTGIPTAPTAATGTSTAQLATCAFVVATAFNAALPGQPGNAGKFVTTDGINAYWSNVAPIYINASVAITAGMYLTDTSAAPLTLTLPAAPAVGACIELIDALGTWSPNALTLSRNGKTIMGVADDLVCNVRGENFRMWYDGTTWRLQ